MLLCHPFGPTNAPGFYSAMMQNFKEEWDLIFTQTLRYIDTFSNNAVSVTEKYRIYLNNTKLVSGSRTIIDDILLFCSNLDAILICLECVCNFFLKYQVIFRLNKYDFLKTRVECVGHDVTEAGKCPAQSKFDLIDDWILPPKVK